MRTYDMEGVSMRKKGNFLSLMVPGLAERRPSLVHGDYIFAKIANSDETAPKYQVSSSYLLKTIALASKKAVAASCYVHLFCLLSPYCFTVRFVFSCKNECVLRALFIELRLMKFI